MAIFNVSLVQMPVTDDKARNLEVAREYVARASEAGAKLVVLPEMFCCPYDNSCFRAYGEEAGGPAWQALSEMARSGALTLVGGSIPELDGDRVFNTSFVFGPDGQQIARHRKMHLFDIDVKGGQRFFESDVLTAGDDVTVCDTPLGKVGVCVCFDIRFPELSRLMMQQGASFIVVPGAFNMTTGPAHWELHMRARAVDNQVFVLGCSPARDEHGSYVSYGNSIAVSPWGEVLGRLGAEEGLLTAEVDTGLVASIRQQLPLFSARRLDLYELRLLKDDK